MKRHIYLVFILISIVLIVSRFGGSVVIDKQIGLLSAMKDVATIIFGVMGAWIAILYPERLSSVYKDDGKSELKNFDKLISPMISSTGIIAYSLMFVVMRPIIRDIAILHDYMIMCRSVSYAIIVFLSLSLLWSLIASLWPMDNIRRILQKRETEQQNRKMYGGK